MPDSTVKRGLLKAREAAHYLNLGRHEFAALDAAGEIRRKRLPGAKRPRFTIAALDEFIARHTAPALAPSLALTTPPVVETTRPKLAQTERVHVARSQNAPIYERGWEQQVRGRRA